MDCLKSLQFTRKPLSAPIFEVVTLDEQKLFTRIDGDLENTLIQIFINSAISKCENFVGGGFSFRNWLQSSDIGFLKGGVLEIKNLWIKSITKLSYFDYNNNEVEILASDFSLIGIDEKLPARILINSDYVIESELRKENTFIVEYTAGKKTVDELPQEIKIAIMSAVSNWYEFRETIKDIPDVSKELLNDLKIWYR